jgi:hypothetical protein
MREMELISVGTGDSITGMAAGACLHNTKTINFFDFSLSDHRKDSLFHHRHPKPNLFDFLLVHEP